MKKLSLTLLLFMIFVMSTSVNQGVKQDDNLQKSLAELQQLHTKIEYVVDSSEKSVELLDKKIIELDSLTK